MRSRSEIMAKMLWQTLWRMLIPCHGLAIICVPRDTFQGLFVFSPVLVHPATLDCPKLFETPLK